MQKLDRLLEIVLILQNSKKYITAQYLAERLDVNIRTIYRYIQTLSSSGIPIESVTGLGYKIQGYHLPPIIFTPKEAAAILMGFEFVSKKVDFSYRKDAESALLKIKSVLKRETLEYVNKIDESTFVFNDKFSDKNIISKIQDAIANCKLIKMQYYSMSKNEITERTIEPMGLIYYSENWRIIAYCKLRKDFREFRLNRINNLKILNKNFDKREFSLSNFVSKEYNIKDPIEIKVFFDKKTARLVKEKYSQGLIYEKESKNGVEMTFLVGKEKEDLILKWILSFHTAAKIVSPDYLKQKMVKMIKEISMLYSH